MTAASHRASLGTGPVVWTTFHNELTSADLAALAIQDAGATMPMPFAPELWWPDWAEWALLRQSPAEVESWIQAALAVAQQPRDTYLEAQAGLLGIELPQEKAISTLPLPARHERWLEMPGTGGWIAYALCVRSGGDLYFWENFAVVCSSPREMLLAGLIAWELGAPPLTELPIWLDTPDLDATLEAGKAGTTYYAVLARHALHGHRDLRILHRDGKPPLWL